jgi:hypothetical protein
VSEVEEKELIKCIQCNDVIECEIKEDEKEMFGQCPNANTTTKSTVTSFARVASSRVSSATKKCVKIA